MTGMICLNPKKRISAAEALNHRYISYLLVDEPDLATRYKDEDICIPDLDDNKLFSVKEYHQKIVDFIEQKTLKARRFDQKTKMIENDIERCRVHEENKKRDKASNRKNSRSVSKIEPKMSVTDPDENYQDEEEGSKNSRKLRNLMEKERSGISEHQLQKSFKGSPMRSKDLNGSNRFGEAPSEDRSRIKFDLDIREPKDGSSQISVKSPSRLSRSFQKSKASFGQK